MPQQLYFKMESMTLLAISEASKICLPSIKAFWASQITFPTTFLSLLVNTLANHLYKLPTKLIGLKSIELLIVPKRPLCPRPNRPLGGICASKRSFILCPILKLVLYIWPATRKINAIAKWWWAILVSHKLCVCGWNPPRRVRMVVLAPWESLGFVFNRISCIHRFPSFPSLLN